MLSSPPEIPPEELWQEKWQKLKNISDALCYEAEMLMKKGRIKNSNPVEPLIIEWMWDILPEIFEKRLGRDREVLRKVIAFHPFIGSTMFFDDPYPFDLPGDALQRCAEELLIELKKENASTDTEILKF